jgi:hypothetical protein
MPIRIVQSGYIHLPQLDWRSGQSAPSLGSCQHCWAQIDTNDFCSRWVKRKIAACADAGIQELTRKAFKQKRPNLPVTTIFKWEVEEIIESRYALVTFKIGHSLARTDRHGRRFFYSN